MRILFLAEEYPPIVKSGSGVAISQWAHALVRRGHEVHVLQCRPRNRVRDERDGEVLVHRRRTVRVPGARRLRRLLLPPGVRRALRKRKVGKPDLLVWRLKLSVSFYAAYRRLGTAFDVVEIPDGPAGLAFAILRPAALVVMFHAPALLAARREWSRSGLVVRISRSLDRFVLRRADVLVSVSPPLVRVLREEGWLKGCPNVALVPPAIDAGPWSSVRPVRETSRVVLSVGRLHREKAPEVLVEAAALLADKVEGLQVVFAGASADQRDGLPYRDWLVERARQLGAPCLVVDPRPHPEMPELYGIARVVAIPSRFDAWPRAGLEAMAAGRPVVCTRRVGLASVVDEAGAGTVVLQDDPAALAAALHVYLEDPATAARAGERGRSFVATRLTPGGSAEQLETVYAEAIRSWRLRRGSPRRSPTCR